MNKLAYQSLSKQLHLIDTGMNHPGHSLKRVFNIDIEICRECGGAVKVIACIEDPVIIKKILTHLKERAAGTVAMLPQGRAPPQKCLFD